MYRAWAEAVWSGTGDAAAAGIKPLHILTKGVRVPLEDFKHACALVRSQTCTQSPGKLLKCSEEVEGVDILTGSIWDYKSTVSLHIYIDCT